MKAEELLQKALDVRPPWSVARVREDLGVGQLDVWIVQGGGRSGWFFGGRQNSAAETGAEAWRHTNLGGCRCVIHAVPQSGDSLHAWQGESGMPFTRGLAQQVVAMMRDGIKLQSICALLDITVADLWRFKHTLDSGKAGLSGDSQGDEAQASAVPAADEPVWTALLDGTLNIDIRLLGLKLLLSKLREQMRVITDEEVRHLKACELQRYFVRYEKTLAHELAQLQNHRIGLGG